MPSNYTEHIDFERQGDHDAVYSDAEKQAKHLTEKYGPEEAREHLADMGYDEDTIDELMASVDGAETRSEDREDDGEVKAKADPSRYEKFDDALLSAIKKSSFWTENVYEGRGDLSKAPRIWDHDDEVPEYVREKVKEVIESTNWQWEDFESLSTEEAERLKELLKEKLTQPQGWSIESLTEDLQREFYLPEDAAVGIATDTSHNILNTAREEGYEEMDGSEEFEYSWINPQDHRTTEVCREIIKEAEDRGGSVTLPTLKQILRQKAQKYEGTRQGGTPDRVDQWQPHYQCRSTFVREVKSF